MAEDASNYIVGKIDAPIKFNKSDLTKGDSIYEDILSWKKKTGYKDKESAELDEVIKNLSKLFSKKGDKYVMRNDTDGAAIEELLEKGREIDPTNIDLQTYYLSFNNSEDEIDVSGIVIEDDGSDISGADLASRTMQMAGISALTLLSPYFVTTDPKKAPFKKGDNPYLPPLNYKDKKGNYEFNSYENAKTCVENSPKLFYTCQAIAQQIKYQKGREEKVSGSIVYSQFFQFTYHGHSFKIFDLMSRYILGKNPELFKEDYLGNSTKSLSLEDKLDLFFVQIVGSKKAKDQVEKFNSGEAYVLFGTDRIKEGVDLQKNSTFLYILCNFTDGCGGKAILLSIVSL